MPRSHLLVVEPTVEPLTIQEAKDHLRFPSSSDEDGLVDGWIRSARQRAEIETGRQLITATWDVRFTRFPEYEIELPYPPLQSVTSVTYRGADGSLHVLASTEYQIDAPGGPTAPAGRIRPAYGVSWPTTQPGAFDAVTIRLVAGYGNLPEAIPGPIRTAMLIMIGDLSEGRQSPQRLTGGSATLADDVVYRLRPYWVRPLCEAA